MVFVKIFFKEVVDERKLTVYVVQRREINIFDETYRLVWMERLNLFSTCPKS